MAGTVGIDFGTSNSVIAVWDEGRGQGQIPVLRGLSHEVRYQIGGEPATARTVPSLIAYQGSEVYIGEEVYARGLSEAPFTFRWMKSYISAQQPLPRRVEGAERCELYISEQTCEQCTARLEGGRICNFGAGRDFLSRLILRAGEWCNLEEDELVFTVPVEAYEHYGNWVSEVCDAAGVRRYRLVDEPVAALFGYEGPVQQGQVFAVVDFGAGTLDVAVLRFDLESQQARKYTVLGKAGAPMGGRNITQWLYEDFLARCGAPAHTVGDISVQILMEVEAAKEELSFRDEANINVLDDRTGKLYAADYRRSDLEQILRDHGLLTRLQAVLDAALDDAEDRGVKRREIAQVLLVGGSTLIPSVRSPLEVMFGERLAFERPFTAVALGACRFAAGGDIVPWIQHNYAIRHYNPRTQVDEFHLLVQRGTKYPSDAPVAHLPVAAVYDGATELGVDIFEMGEARTAGADQIVFDEKGRARTIRTQGADHHYWINRDRRTFLRADPPANKDEHRFDLTFSVDGNRRLLMTAMDLLTREYQYRDYPVAKLK